MMNYNARDIPKVITPEDIIRRYNLDKLVSDRKAISVLKDSLTKIDSIAEKFAKTLLSYAENQTDGYITVWFFNGIPTTENEPYKNFDTDYINNKINDLYYDKDTGNVYILNSDLEWEICTDETLKQVIAVANADIDTEDNKRNYFTSQPSPPYDVGDFWYESGIIMRCRCSRAEGSFHQTDWCLQKDYSDNSVILETRAILDQLKTYIDSNTVSQAQLETTKDSILGTVSTETTKITQQLNDYALIENVEVVNQKVENLQTSTSQVITIVEDIQINGVNKVKTEKGFTFDNQGMTIDELNSPTKSITDTNGIQVIDKTGHINETLLFAGYDEELKESLVKTKNIVVEKYLNIGTHSRIEDYSPENETPGTGVFYI